MGSKIVPNPLIAQIHYIQGEYMGLKIEIFFFFFLLIY